MGIDKSNPFERSGDEVELYREYGSGGQIITFREEKGVAEGKAVSDEDIGAAGSGAPRNPSSN